MSESEDDLYKVLEVKRNSSYNEIRKSYFKLAMKYHPDKNKDSGKEFQKINEAYSVLSDDEKRFNYDLFNTTQEEGPLLKDLQENSEEAKDFEMFLSELFDKGKKRPRNSKKDKNQIGKKQKT